MFGGASVRSVAALAVLFVTLTTIRCQEDPEDEVDPDLPSSLLDNEGHSDFITPNTIDDSVDQFTYKDNEYLVVDKKMKKRQAELMCHSYGASLAIVTDIPLAKFLAEALSETNLVMDALWVAGYRYNDDDSWKWKINANQFEPIETDIVHLMETTDVTATDRLCLAFARLDHDKPQLRPLTCHANRALLCERPRVGGGGGTETHPGWIKLGTRLYKIFNEPVPYELATLKCYEKDPEAQLAVVVSYKNSQNLGRYLLIGRPSLENAWIAARWVGNQYRFEPEPVYLANTTADTQYPPWRNNSVQKTGGCILLDRHLSNITLFVEARCERNRPYICYKRINDIGDSSFSDIIIDEWGYRIQYNLKSWVDARDFCAKRYVDYDAFLSEIPDREILSHMLYIMGENRTTIQHIWIGGQYVDEEWVWDRNNTPIDKDVLNMVDNTTFTPDAEAENLCLNMDRENHFQALHYGTNCQAQQIFVCTFSADKLKELEDDEHNRYETKRLLKNTGT